MPSHTPAEKKRIKAGLPPARKALAAQRKKKIKRSGHNSAHKTR